MREFATATLSRQEFLDWLGGDRTDLTGTPYQMVEPSRRDRQVVLLYRPISQSALDQPIVAIPIEEISEFFAFMATYVASYKPFSAFHRVMPLELVEEFENRRPLEAEMIGSVAKLVAGGVVAEHFLRERSRVDLAGSVLSTAKSTLSATLGSAVIAGYEQIVIAWISDQWASVNRRDRAIFGSAATTDILAIWNLLFSAIRDEASPSVYHGSPAAQAVSIFLRTAMETGVTPDILSGLRVVSRGEIEPEKLLTASREDRIRSFNRFVAGMNERSAVGLEEPFMAGLLLAIVGNGSFDMLRSARELAERSPVSIIWFGICAALFEESNILTTANCLGRRLVRDLCSTADPFGPPRADLSLFEYRAMTREPEALAQMVTGNADALRIEILPGVDTYVARGSIDRERRLNEDYNLMADSFREIRLVVDRVTRRMDLTSDYRQRDLYVDDAKPRRRR
ncbi:hypothetical protein M2330_001187 [Sphingobium sp. B10D3B]|nr:hypothetical protein [Sphingobium sp. B10D3B]